MQHREIESGLMLSREQSTNASPAGTNHQPALMAYSPVGHGRGLLNNATLKKIAKRHDGTPGQIALAWVLCQPDVIAIPKASSKTHVRDNARAVEIKLTNQDFADIDGEFPSPKST